MGMQSPTQPVSLGCICQVEIAHHGILQERGKGCWFGALSLIGCAARVPDSCQPGLSRGQPFAAKANSY